MDSMLVTNQRWRGERHVLVEPKDWELALLLRFRRESGAC